MTLTTHCCHDRKEAAVIMTLTTHCCHDRKEATVIMTLHIVVMIGRKLLLS